MPRVIKLRKKPKPPQQKKMVQNLHSLLDGNTLQDLCDEAAEVGVPLNKVFISKYCLYDEYVVELYFEIPYLDVGKVKRYEEDLEKYEEWYEKNKEDIEYTLEFRRKERERKENEKRKAALERATQQKQQLEAKIQRLTADLNKKEGA